MQIVLIEFTADERGFKKGNLDFKVVYTPEKWEIFRNVSYFEKDNRKWLNIQNVKKNDLWLAVYERQPSLKKIFEEVLDAMKNAGSLSNINSQEESVFDR